MSKSALPAAALLLAILAPAASGQSRPNLSGHWVLKADPTPAADSAAAPADSARTVGDSAGTVGDSARTAGDSARLAGDSARPVGPASDLRPILQRRGRPEEQQQLTRLMGMAQPVVAFRLTQVDTAVTFVNEDGFTYVVRPNRDWDSFVVGDQTIRFRARWRGPALEIEFRPEGGGRIIETYQLSDSGAYLRVEVVVEHDILAQRLWRPRMYRLAGPA
jgi:hypothetical protein